MILRCVNKDEVDMLIKELHSRYCGGHFVPCTIMHRILRACYYWPTLFTDTHCYVRSCHACQFFSWKQRFLAFPLKPVVIEATFQQWGL